MHTFSRNYRWGLLCQGKRVMEWKRARRGWSTRQKPGKSLGRRWRPWLAHRSVDLPWSRKKKAPRDANYLMCLNTWKEIYTMQGKCGNNLVRSIQKAKKNDNWDNYEVQEKPKLFEKERESVLSVRVYHSHNLWRVGGASRSRKGTGWKWAVLKRWAGDMLLWVTILSELTWKTWC